MLKKLDLDPPMPKSREVLIPKRQWMEPLNPSPRWMALLNRNLDHQMPKRQLTVPQNLNRQWMEPLNQSRDHQIPKMPMFLTKISGISSNGSLMHRMLNPDLQIPKRQWTEPQNPNRQWMEPLNLNQDRNLVPKMDLMDHLEANLDPLMNNLAVNQHLKTDHLDPNQDRRMDPLEANLDLTQWMDLEEMNLLLDKWIS